jgi:hypothetical protein
VDREGRLIGVAILDVAEGQIQAVSSIVNPGKLRHGPARRPERAATRAQLDSSARGLELDRDHGGYPKAPRDDG